MLSRTKISAKGDTIVEVMLAMTLLTAFLFISWGITNRATQIGINSQKRVEMVNAMKEQAEIIKAQYAKSGYKINDLISSVQATAIGLDDNPCTAPSITASTVFHYANNSGTLVKNPNKKQIPDADSWLAVQYKPNPESDPQYYDFYVRACWRTIGSVQNTDSAQFIVRLNRENLASVVTPPSDTFIEDSGTTTLVFEDYRPSADRDYNDYVVGMNVVETYKNDYLERITIDYTPKKRGGGFVHQLWLVFDGEVDGGVNNIGLTGSRSYKSADMFAGNANIAYQLTADGVVGAEQVVAKTSNLQIFSNSHNTLTPSGAVRQTGRVVITGFEQIPANNRASRGDFNIKRYRTFLRMAAQTVPVNVTTPGDDIDLVDIHPNMFDNNPTNPYPLAFFVPANWFWPDEATSIDSKYENFIFHAQYLNALRTNPNAVEDPRGTNWYE